MGCKFHHFDALIQIMRGLSIIFETIWTLCEKIIKLQGVKCILPFALFCIPIRNMSRIPRNNKTKRIGMKRIRKTRKKSRSPTRCRVVTRFNFGYVRGLDNHTSPWKSSKFGQYIG